MLEKEIEKYLVVQCKRRGWLPYKFTSPGRRSVPDRVIVLSPSGLVVFVELKGTGQKPTVRQHREMALLTAAGADVTVIDSIEGVDAWMSRCEIINKTLSSF